MTRWTIQVACKKDKKVFYGRQIIEREQKPKKGEIVSSIKCPLCKKKVVIEKVF